MKYDCPEYRATQRRYRIDDCSQQVRAIEEGRVKFRGYSTGWYPGDAIDSQTLPGISSVGTLDTVGWQQWGTGAHRNEGIEVCYLETGSTVLHLGKRRFDLGADTVTVTRPWQLHRLGNPGVEHCRLHWFILDVGVRGPRQSWAWPDWIVLSQRDLADLGRLLARCRSPVLQRATPIARAFRQIAEGVAAEEASGFSEIAVGINAALLGLLQVLRSRDTPGVRADPLPRQAAVGTFLNQLSNRPEWLAEPWTLEAMASRCGLRTTAFVKHCRTVTNQSPWEYLVEARIRRATTLLAGNPERSITEIAMTCGFSSSQYFATQFKRRTGRTPRAWRKENRG